MLCLSLTACSTASSLSMRDGDVARDPFIAEVDEHHTEPSQTTVQVATPATEPVADAEHQRASIDLSSATIHDVGSVESVAFETAAEMADAEPAMFLPTAKHSPTAGTVPQGSPITFDHARPRHDNDGEISPMSYQTAGPAPLSYEAGVVNVRKMALDHVDEYLVDGGDCGYPIHYEGSTVAGVESEDTFVEFHQQDGSRHVVPSNTVAVYAPRFGTLRTMTGTETGAIVERASSTRDTIRDSGIHSRVIPSQHRQADEAGGLSMRNRASGMLARNKGADIAHSSRATQHELLQNVFEDSLITSTGKLDQNNQAWLANGMQAADIWTKNQRALLVVTDEGQQEVYHAERVAELSALDEEHLKPGRLRLVKVADKRTAQIGEEVTFSLRYDNLGDRTVEQVRIIDHLTSRLEIIEESISWGPADSPLGTWDIADHEDGGTVLIFVLKESLAGKSGGVITFSCRVR